MVHGCSISRTTTVRIFGDELQEMLRRNSVALMSNGQKIESGDYQQSTLDGKISGLVLRKCILCLGVVC